MRFIYHNQIIIDDLHFVLKVFVPGELIHRSDTPVRFRKHIAGNGIFNFIVCQNFKAKVKLAEKLVLPLLSQISRTDYHTAAQIAACNQFF